MKVGDGGHHLGVRVCIVERSLAVRKGGGRNKNGIWRAEVLQSG